MLAVYLPVFLIFDDKIILFFSISNPASSSFLAISELVTEPNNLSPSITLAEILMSDFSSFFKTLFASSIADLSLFTDCFNFSAKAFLAEIVASIALPWGIRKFLP